MNPLIIDRPDLQTLAQRYGFLTLTFFFWFAWIYLWLPLISVLAWFFELRIVYDQMVLLQGAQSLFDNLRVYRWVFLCIAGVYVTWALVNNWRFRGRSRRSEVDAVPMRDIAQVFGLEPHALGEHQNAKTVTITHDEFGQINAVHPTPSLHAHRRQALRVLRPPNPPPAETVDALRSDQNRG